MNTLLTKEERKRIAKYCKNDPYKMFAVLDQICKELQLTDIRTFASKSIKSERTIYNMVKDVEFAEIEVLVICNEKFIPAVLNKHLLK